MTMTSSRPYLLRALYEWMLDNQCTPHILVFADAEGVEVPRDHVQNGQIVLNIAPTAVVHLLIDKEAISFNARFSGKSMDIYIPMHAIMGIVTRENGQGMMFDFSEPPPDRTTGDGLEQKKPTGKPTLKRVK